MTENQKKRMTIVATLAVTLGLDQITKVIVRNTMDRNIPIEVIGDYAKLVYVENDGAMLSMGNNLPDFWKVVLLSVVPAAILLALLVYTFIKIDTPKNQRFGLSLILGGGIGNVADRIFYGSVTDFMNVGIGDCTYCRTGIFNVADMAIMLGIGILLVSQYRGTKKSKSSEERTQAEPAAKVHDGA